MSTTRYLELHKQTNDAGGGLWHDCCPPGSTKSRTSSGLQSHRWQGLLGSHLCSSSSIGSSGPVFDEFLNHIMVLVGGGWKFSHFGAYAIQCFFVLGSEREVIFIIFLVFWRFMEWNLFRNFHNILEIYGLEKMKLYKTSKKWRFVSGRRQRVHIQAFQQKHCRSELKIRIGPWIKVEIYIYESGYFKDVH